MKKIALTKGKFALVDDADYDRVRRYRWCLFGDYAYRKEGTENVAMHRFILGLPNRVRDGVYVDHRDGNKLNNQRSNLRLATKAQNSMNRPAQSNNKSGFRGVCLASWGGKWKASIYHERRHLHIGYFYRIEEAAAAYDAKAIELFGEYARTNSSLGLL